MTLIKQVVKLLIDQYINSLSYKEKGLVRLINQGFALDESIEATRKHLEKLEEIKKTASNGKFKLK